MQFERAMVGNFGLDTEAIVGRWKTAAWKFGIDNQNMVSTQVGIRTLHPPTAGVLSLFDCFLFDRYPGLFRTTPDLSVGRVLVRD
jgi:hypothetical protein